MYPGPGAAARASQSRRLLARLLAGSFLSGVLAFATTGGVAIASGETGSVAVVGLPLAIQLECFGCPFTPSAPSSGQISGLDGVNPYDVTWTNATLSVNGRYSSTCSGGVWALATVDSADATISGIQMRYVNAATGAVSTWAVTVRLTFTGLITAAAFEPATQQITITGGPSTISIVNLGIAGVMPLVPSIPPPVCPNTATTFTASGTFLTLGAG
jgi:hypothetical protein